MDVRTKNAGVVSLVLVSALAVLTFTACGGGSTAASPSPTGSQSGAGSGLLAAKAYVEQVKPILSQVGTTVGALPEAVAGLNKKPDSTWTDAATKLDDIAAQLDDEAASLDTLAPPSALQPVQDAAVKGIQAAQSAVTKMAEGLNKGVATAATASAAIQAQIDALTSQLSGLSQGLSDAVGGLLGSPGASPAP